MTITKPWLIGITVFVLLVAVLSGFLWLQEHDARLKAESAQSAQQQVIAAAQKSVDQAKADQAQTASDLKSQLAAISAQRVVVVTPQQAAATMNALPNLPTQVQVQQVPAQPTTVAPTQIGDSVQGCPSGYAYQLHEGLCRLLGAPIPASQQIVIPQADIPAFQAYKLNCDESNAKLSACSLNAASAAVIQQGTASQLAAMTKERDTWEATAKGGTFWQRFKHDAIQITITAGVAYAAGRLTK